MFEVMRAAAAKCRVATIRIFNQSAYLAGAYARALSDKIKAVPARHWRDAAALGAGAGLAAFFTFGFSPTRQEYGVLGQSLDLASAVSQMAAAGSAGLAPVEPTPDQATLGTVISRLQARSADELAPTIRALTVVLKPGDTLSTALNRAGAPMAEVEQALAALGDKLDLRRLRPGQKIKLELERQAANDSTQLNKLAVLASYDRRVVVERDGGGFNAESQGLSVTPMTMAHSGEIQGSLYYSALKAGVPEPVIVDFIRIFSYEVDFQRDIQAGDKFAILFDRDVVAETGQAGNGPVLYGRLEMGERVVELYRHEGKDGQSEYFRPDGKSVRQLLMKTPIDGARLTSGFGARRHPVLGYTRMHKGVDFGAGTGTPIYAAGDGSVVMAQRYKGYGNYVRLRHTGGYETAYGHMSRFAKGMRPGVRVRQGQVIGYVGSTGMSTGPHLHYEVLQKNTQVNPLKLRFSSGRTLGGTELAGFKAANDGRMATLERILWANDKLAAAGSTARAPHQEEAR